MPEIDYLESARVLLEFDAPTPEDVALVQVHALISIAESLAVIADRVQQDTTHE